MRGHRQKQPIDPEAIFNHAIRFVGTDNYLRSAPGGGPIFANMIAPPSMILSAFGIELLLKCLLVKSKGSAPETHHLGVLFRQLDHKHKRRIEEIWNSGPKRKIQELCRKTNNPDDLPNAINKCASAFEDLRYVYEDPSKVVFYIAELGQVLVDFIVELEPGWRPTMLNPPSPPPVLNH